MPKYCKLIVGPSLSAVYLGIRPCYLFTRYRDGERTFPFCDKIFQ